MNNMIKWFSHSAIVIYTLKAYFNILFFPKAWMQNKVPIPAPNEVLNDRKEDIKLEEKKKTQAEIEQEMATLQYTNPQLLEVSSLGDSRCSKKVAMTLLICS